MSRKDRAMKVVDLMTKNAACVRRNESLSTAARIMWDYDCGVVPVLDESGQKVVGMLTDRDICMTSWSHSEAPGSIQVSQAMSRQVFSCSPDDDLFTAEEVMRARQVLRLPVVDAQGKVMGVVSLADIAGCRAQDKNQAA